ncbi:serine hydrolase domain-containing protein [Georgenia halophila]|uniref:Serine hydrolase domain-containing protein n=1 Tax=Georgenia halophila TaxID=620889 RepID=A0ABP8L470_9MICO
MFRTARRTALMTTVAVLAVPAATATAAPDETTAVDRLGDDPTELSRLVADAAAEAAARQQGGRAMRAPDSQQTLTAGLDAAVSGLVEGGAVGVTARVETPETVWRGADGDRELDHAPPAHPQDRFRVGSITKSMVAALVMQEVERGTWTLETSVEEVLPGVLPDGVTIGQLLSHRSGAPDFVTPAILERVSDPSSVEQFFDALEQDYTDPELVEAARSLPWLFEPGTDFTYSNTGYVVLGMMLEEVTGRSVESLLEDRVFAPASMRHTELPDEPGTKGPFLVGAAYTGAQGEGWYNLDAQDPSLFSSAGAVTSTTEDLEDFTAALVTGDLVDPALVEQMLTPRSVESLEYGLGVYRVPDPCEPGEYLYGHDGATFGTLAITLTSADGERQVAAGITGRNVSADPEALYDINDLLVPMLLATCSS